MTDDEIEAMIYDIVSHIDYDTAKQLDESTAEEPDAVAYLVNELVNIAKQHMEK